VAPGSATPPNSDFNFRLFDFRLYAMPTQTDALSNVYAKSLYELAQQAGGQDKINEVLEELEQTCDLLRENRAFAQFMASPVIDRQQRSESLRRIFGDRVTDLTLRFLMVLNKKGRLGRLESIAAAFDHMVQEAFGRVEVDVFTPGPLGPEQLDMLHKRIQQALGREPVLHPYTEPAMIGGIKLRIEDQLIDGSVASRLRRMKRDILTDGASKLRDRIERFIDE
jgi:F-type H+-transporting ATPase subunit delta